MPTIRVDRRPARPGTPASSPRPAGLARGAGLASLAAAAAAAATGAALAGPGVPAEVVRESPSVDRWFYPFNGTPGTRSDMSLFGTTGIPDFDDRDGQAWLRWDVAPEIPAGLGADGYEILSLRVVVQNASTDVVLYDDTVDPFTAFLPPEDPEFTVDDPGQPLELFGVAGRNGADPVTYAENGPFSPGPLIGTELRNLFPVDFGGPGGTARDVSNEVRDRFTAESWAIGTIDGILPGDPIPTDAVISFEVDLTVPGVQAALGAQLDQGVVTVLLTSLRLVEQQAGEFVRVYTKENPFVAAGLADAARLEITWRPADPAPDCPADFDDSGAVDFNDLLATLGAWGPCGGCPQDLDGSGTVGFEDLLSVLGTFGPCP